MLGALYTIHVISVYLWPFFRISSAKSGAHSLFGCGA
jgi:hypothetical protein